MFIRCKNISKRDENVDLQIWAGEITEMDVFRLWELFEAYLYFYIISFPVYLLSFDKISAY